MRALRTIPLALAALLALPAAPSATASSPRLYVSLGDSLSAGVQPDKTGKNRPTAEGYVDRVATSLRSHGGPLRVLKLGCGGTTATLMSGAHCTGAYGAGSQLAQAERVLRANPGRIGLVTLDVGDNDVEHCMSLSRIDAACVKRGLAQVRTNLPKIAARLRAAAGPGVKIVGLADYDQFLAAWRKGPAGRRIALSSRAQLDRLTATMRAAYRSARVVFADAAPRFATHDWTLVRAANGTKEPRAVSRICSLTWACSAKPIGFNDHAKPSGYAAIAAAVIATGATR
jgi:lysophospholipase L1-like esterase